VVGGDGGAVWNDALAVDHLELKVEVMTPTGRVRTGTGQGVLPVLNTWRRAALDPGREFSGRSAQGETDLRLSGRQFRFQWV
jgi:hypothetical protein